MPNIDAFERSTNMRNSGNGSVLPITFLLLMIRTKRVRHLLACALRYGKQSTRERVSWLGNVDRRSRSGHCCAKRRSRNSNGRRSAFKGSLLPPLDLAARVLGDLFANPNVVMGGVYNALA